jgi:hypothetical protein
MKLTTTHYIIIGIIVLSLILYFMKDKIKSAFARGLQNNNPGNIRKDGTTWKGEKSPSTDKDFKQFNTRADGYRAMFVNLRGYINGGFNTIDKIISRWAPSSENDTKAYIVAVTKQTGIDPQKTLSFTDTANIRKIVAAISQHENGVPANMDEVDSGFKILNT